MFICLWPFALVDGPMSRQIEAIPDLIMAFAILLWLPSFPFSATFLTPRERAIVSAFCVCKIACWAHLLYQAQARLNLDHKPRSHGGMNGWQGLKAISIDPNAWLLMTVYASCMSTPFAFWPRTNPDFPTSSQRWSCHHFVLFTNSKRS